MNKEEIPTGIKVAVEFMRRSFGGTNVEIVSEVYRLSPSKDAPAGALGCDIHISIPNYEMQPIQMFLSNYIGEDMAFHRLGGAPQIAQMIADEIVFGCIKPEYEKLKKKSEKGA